MKISSENLKFSSVQARLIFFKIRALWVRFGDRTVRAVPVFGSGGSSKEGFLCVSAQFHREDGSGSGFGSWKTVPAVPVPRSVPAKTVPTVPVSGSGSVPAPPCSKCYFKISGYLK